MFCYGANRRLDNPLRLTLTSADGPTGVRLRTVHTPKDLPMETRPYIEVRGEPEDRRATHCLCFWMAWVEPRRLALFPPLLSPPENNQVYDKESLVYLTAESETMLDDVADGDVYIIGGLVRGSSGRGFVGCE